MRYYTTAAEEASALMESLAKNHDGNRRAAFAAAHTILLIDGYALEVDPPANYEFIMDSPQGSSGSPKSSNG